jgi:hypothetical protein
MNDQYQTELRAYEAHRKLMEDAAAVRRLFEEAGMAVPPSLLRLFSEDGATRQRKPPSMSLRHPDSPAKPIECGADCIWIPLKDLYPQTVVLGILRRSDGFVPLADVLEGVSKICGDGINTGSIYNTGPRLEEQGLIERGEAGWRLLDKDKAPILTEDAAWGLARVFNKHEIAAHRRIALLHLLEASTDGLQIMQITRTLETWDFCRAPVDKDLIKGDIASLRKDKRIKQIGNTRKWTIVTQKTGNERSSRAARES